MIKNLMESTCFKTDSFHQHIDAISILNLIDKVANFFFYQPAASLMASCLFWTMSCQKNPSFWAHGMSLFLSGVFRSLCNSRCNWLLSKLCCENSLYAPDLKSQAFRGKLDNFAFILGRSDLFRLQTESFNEKLGEGRKYLDPNQMQICKQSFWFNLCSQFSGT